MMFLTRAHNDRQQVTRPRPAVAGYVPYYALYGRLPGWVADHLRQLYPTTYRNPKP